MLCLKLPSSCANRACNSLCCLRTAAISSARSVGLRVCRAHGGQLSSFRRLLAAGTLLAQGAAFPQELDALLSDFLGSFCLRLAEACNLPRLRFPQIRDILPQSTERLLKRLARLSERPGVARHP